MFTFILLLTLSTAVAVDPWKVNIGGRDDSLAENILSKNELIQCQVMEQTLDDTFYKKLVNLIIFSDSFKIEDNVVEGHINFRFPVSEFELLKTYASKKEQLEPNDYRRIDGLLSEHVVQLSRLAQANEAWCQVLLMLIQDNFVYFVILLASLITIYPLYLLCLHVPTNKRFLIFAIIIVLFCIGWEVIMAWKEAEFKDYDEFRKAVADCNSIWNFWQKEECTPIVRKISHFWHQLHPLKIFMNLVTRLMRDYIVVMFSSLHGITLDIKDNLPPFVNYAAYITLNTLLLIILIILPIALLINLAFNRSISFSYLGLYFNSSSRSHNPLHSSIPSSSLNFNPQEKHFLPNASGDSISGQNMNILFELIKDKQSNTNKTHHKSLSKKTNKQKKTVVSKNVHQEIKPQTMTPLRRVSSLPYITGGEEILRK